jgi:serine/threonine protein kinase
VFSVGWGRRTRLRAEGVYATERARARRNRYLELRAEGLEALTTGRIDTAIDRLAAAAILCRGLVEAHTDLASAFKAAGQLEAARQTLEIGLQHARKWRNEKAVTELNASLFLLPSPPPVRADFTQGQELYSALTDSRWTVLDRRAGGMGVVYKVRDHADAVIHALKTLKAQFIWSAADRGRFIREASTWVRLDPHPNVVSAEWVEVIEGFPCLVMEWLEGGDLATLLAAQPLTASRAIELGIEFCEGMAFAHKCLGIVHRDVKPENCLLTSAGVLKITDFGLARSFRAAQLTAFELSGVAPETRAQLTSPYGTLPYMAPEQLDPEAVLDTTADIYAFGVMLYEMLTRDLPVQAAGLEGDQIAAGAKRHKLPRRLRDLVLACVAGDSYSRPASFDDVRLELSRILRRSYHRRPLAAPAVPAVDARYWNNKAVGFQALEQYDDAIACYDRALQLTPNDSDVVQNKGVALLSKKEYERAITMFDHALRLSPGDAEILGNKGFALLRSGRINDGVSCLTRAAQISPRDPIVCKNLADGLCQLGRADEALDAIHKGLIFDSRNPALLAAQGFALLMLARHDEALTSFEKGLEISPRSAEHWKGKAIVHSRRSEYAEAVDAADKALEVSPGDNEVLRCKTDALLGLRRLQGASDGSDALAPPARGDVHTTRFSTDVDAGAYAETPRTSGPSMPE